jgi:hypothetical protein
MRPLNSNRVAWSVAAAALALWATSVPTTWGNVASGAARLFDQGTEDTTTSTSITTTTDINVNDMTVVAPADGQVTEQCLPISPAVAEIVPAIPPVTIPTVSTLPNADQGSYRVCGADANIARAIEQLIAGRGFSTALVSRGDGCADLTVRVTSPSTSGSATSNLNVSIGSGRSLSMRIVSEHGATHVELMDR